MFTKRFPLLVLTVSLIFFIGCSKKMPDGMPKLYPVSISVTQEGKPFADAVVSLRYADPSAGTWAIGGHTGADGTAKLYTQGYPGAPAGKFKVVLIKEDNEGLTERGDAEARGDAAAAKQIKVKIWSCVEARYNDPKQTPLAVEIAADTKVLDIDAGPAVKIDRPFVP